MLVPVGSLEVLILEHGFSSGSVPRGNLPLFLEVLLGEGSFLFFESFVSEATSVTAEVMGEGAGGL